MDERILTQHPEGKHGVNISRHKYDIICNSIVESLRAHGERTFQDLTEDVSHRLEGRFEGSINWYVTNVKLDLEAKGVIEHIPKTSPRRLRLTQR